MHKSLLTVGIFIGSLLVGSPARAEEVAASSSVRGYAEVTDGCLLYLSGPCLNVRSGPGTSYGIVQRLRIGAVIEIDSKIEKDGVIWYHIKQDTGLKPPEEIMTPVKSPDRWYIAAAYTRWIGSVSEPAKDSTKKIVVDLSEQKIYAYENGQVVFETSVSTGLNDKPTPKGTFTVFRKTPSRYMQGPDYDLPGVPWDMYFTAEGAAIHGAYWHKNFGKHWSHGCVNLPLNKSEWLYLWTPVGTRVTVQQ